MSESYQGLILAADLKVFYVKYGFIIGKCLQLTVAFHSQYLWYFSSLHYKIHVFYF